MIYTRNLYCFFLSFFFFVILQQIRFPVCSALRPILKNV